MELAKVTTKGQITLPIGIRRKLGINNGDKVLFIEESGKIYITKPSVQLFSDHQGDHDVYYTSQSK